MKLFRPEAIDHHRRRLLGDVIIVQPVGHIVMTALLVTLVLAGALAFFIGGYHEQNLTGKSTKATPTLMSVPSTTNGVIDEIHVDRGAEVEPGDPLITIRRAAPRQQE